jgi:hypothetical protein
LKAGLRPKVRVTKLNAFARVSTIIP